MSKPGEILARAVTATILAICLAGVCCLAPSYPPGQTGCVPGAAALASGSSATSLMDGPLGCLAQFCIHYSDFEEMIRPVPAHSWDKWGLGISEEEYVSNDPGYDWYINQNKTGKYGFENCGPACVTMACEWSDPYFSHKTEEARDTYHADGGWWYMDDIAAYMDIYGIPYNESMNLGDERILRELRAGYILIINIDLSALTYNKNQNQHVDKFYSGGTGHFIILKGFVLVDNQLFYECYDPANSSYYYSLSKEPKGKDRYYRASEIQTAMATWYNNYLVVKPMYEHGD